MSILRSVAIHDVKSSRPILPSRIASACLTTLVAAVALCGGLTAAEETKPAWFIDGYHGGVYGHYPPGYTGFLVEQLKAHPWWRINLEIEPETWDVARVYEPAAYAEFKKLLEDQSDSGRIEVVNPAYAQSYFFQSSGESVIRQFEYGIRKMREHFPNVVPTTYSSEEPCFTSCLPPVLWSFGFQFASLKNPNTCWGGYTTAHGGELLNWIGPDGTPILTVPRYASEELQPDSSWQTTANRNSPEYLAAARRRSLDYRDRCDHLADQLAGRSREAWRGRPRGMWWGVYEAADLGLEHLPNCWGVGPRGAEG